MTSSHRFTSQERTREEKYGPVEQTTYQEHNFIGKVERYCSRCGIYEEEDDGSSCFILRSKSKKI